LAEAILDLYRNPALRETMGRLGRRYAEENHSKQVAVARYNELLQRIAVSN
jgi:glycosyltransferase involved in cell wall biosynthesis